MAMSGQGIDTAEPQFVESITQAIQVIFISIRSLYLFGNKSIITLGSTRRHGKSERHSSTW